MPTRRDFVAGSAAALAGARLSDFSRPAADPAEAGRGMPRPATSIVLFQGDSITDAGRNRTRAGANDFAALGAGYPMLLAAELRTEYPQADLQVFNRGISGHKVPDLQARWQADTIDLKPNVLSILIGVNDIWHTRMKNYNGTAAIYETGYAALLAGTRAALPQVQLVVMEPFVLKVGAVDASWFPEFDDYRAAAKRVAKGAGAIFVPLHDYLGELARKSGPAYWAADGVHPTLAGHEAIATQWRKVVGKHAL